MKKYNIIYADPPWQYEQKGVEGAAAKIYPTMALKELCRLPVADLTEKDAVLFLWTTFPMLPNALQLIRAWGFRYKSTAFVWLKQNKSGHGWFFGLGFWTRGNAEIASWVRKAIQSENPNEFISLSSALYRSIAKNLMKRGKKS